MDIRPEILVLLQWVSVAANHDSDDIPSQNFEYGYIVVVAFVFNVPPTSKVIWRQGHSLKSHPTDW